MGDEGSSYHGRQTDVSTMLRAPFDQGPLSWLVPVCYTNERQRLGCKTLQDYAGPPKHK